MMTDKEFFDWLETCPSKDWHVMDADPCSVEIRFPIKMLKDKDKSKLRVLNSCSTELWITDEELKEANKQALEIFDEFYDNIGHGEETWTEIQVGDKFFDINCWDEGIGYDYPSREGAVHCSIYPTIELDNGYRYCEGDKYLRLFTVDKTLGEE